MSVRTNQYGVGKQRESAASSGECVAVGEMSRAVFLVGSLALMSTACVRMDVPRNSTSSLFSPEHSSKMSHLSRNKLTYSENRCAPAGSAKFLLPASKRKSKSRRMPSMRYSAGDRLHLMIMDSPSFTGDYAVNVDGTVILPYVGEIRAAGLTNRQLTRKIKRILTRQLSVR